MIIDEMAKVLIRSGMHCAHPFFKSRNIDGCARASFYLYNSEAEAKRFVEYDKTNFAVRLFKLNVRELRRR